MRPSNTTYSCAFRCFSFCVLALLASPHRSSADAILQATCRSSAASRVCFRRDHPRPFPGTQDRISLILALASFFRRGPDGDQRSLFPVFPRFLSAPSLGARRLVLGRMVLALLLLVALLVERFLRVRAIRAEK